MGFCDKCGKLIEDGMVFCKKCSSIINGKDSPSSVSSTAGFGEDHEIFTFKARSSMWVRLTQFLPYLIGIIIFFIGVLPFFLNSLDISLYLPLFSIGAIILGVLVVFLISRRSDQNPTYFLALILLLLTLGGMQIFPDYTQIIFPLGVIISCLFLIFPIFREKTRKISYLFAVLIIISALGSNILFPAYTLIIFQITFILSGVAIFISRI
jgi:hypothetical protein